MGYAESADYSLECRVSGEGELLCFWFGIITHRVFEIVMHKSLGFMLSLTESTIRKCGLDPIHPQLINHSSYTMVLTPVKPQNHSDIHRGQVPVRQDSRKIDEGLP